MKPVYKPLLTLGAVATLLLTLPSHKQEEGMFPLNYLNESELQSAGMKLSAKDIFNPGEIALTNALVKLGGCTGSFISETGLIITNHHCVYGGVSDLSNSDHNYLENGFVARAKEQELPVNMPCRITQSYEDVSSRVLKGVADNMDPADRASLIGSNIKTVVAEEKAKTPELSVEISEMFTGKSYTLFRYFLITDVRLVYVPPVTIGQFGGDQDNWEWPRHNGDFSIVRAYVGPDGKPAKYSSKNVPYKPAKHLRINTKGTKENDFVFIMGYPGRTFRHESAPYMKFQQDVQLPEVQKFYKFMIDQMREKSKGNENKFLAFAGTIQSLENTEKNYRGKIQGLKRTNLVMHREQEEEAMQKMVESTPAFQNRKHVIPEIQKQWDLKTGMASARYTHTWLSNQSNPFYAAQMICLSEEVLDTAKDTAVIRATYTKLRNSMQAEYRIIDIAYEKALLTELLNRLQPVSPALKKFLGKSTPEQWVAKNALQEKLYDTSWVMKTLRKKPKQLIEYEGPLVKLFEVLLPEMAKVEKDWNDCETRLKALMPQYLDIKQEFKKGQFIPDANSTLRLTYGYIKRYSPNDAEINMPYTTLRGVFEKANSSADYRLPQVQADNLKVENAPAMFKDPETGEVIVCFLYNLDTTGGNSGSPVLDANGDLIGVNFDRSFTATLNDYAWNEKYSRSIGVDIRYVIYVMKYVGKATELLQELNIAI